MVNISKFFFSNKIIFILIVILGLFLSFALFKPVSAFFHEEIDIPEIDIPEIDIPEIDIDPCDLFPEAPGCDGGGDDDSGDDDDDFNWCCNDIIQTCCGGGDDDDFDTCEYSCEQCCDIIPGSSSWSGACLLCVGCGGSTDCGGGEEEEPEFDICEYSCEQCDTLPIYNNLRTNFCAVCLTCEGGGGDDDVIILDESCTQSCENCGISDVVACGTCVGCVIFKIIDFLIGFPARITLIIMVWAIAIFAMISGIIFVIIAGFSKQLIEAYLSIPVTEGWVVETGFEFTKNFANMFIILILAFIGLATILKIKDYEARKILPKLIMVALLINFTPVMIGFIVDIANLFTNFFFTEIAKSDFIDSSAIFDDIKNAVDKMVVMSTDINLSLMDVMEEFMIIIIKSLVKIAFFTIASLVFIMVIFLLFARIIMLWILVILAPIAFFSQILPEGVTVKAILPSILHWNEWWKTLIQWSFLTIPLGFFLYLAAGIMSSMGDIMTLNATPIVLDIMGITFSIRLDEIMQSVIGPMTAIGILIFGIMISIESMPDIAKKAIKAVTKGAKKLGKIARKRAGKLAKRPALALGGKIGKRMQSWGGRLRSFKKDEQAGWWKRRGRGIRRKIGAATEIIGLQAVAAEQEIEATDADKAKKQVQGKTESKQMATLQLALAKSKAKVPGSTAKVIGIMEALLEDKNLEKAEKAGIIREKELAKNIAKANSMNRKTLNGYDVKITAQVLNPEKWKQAQELIETGDIKEGKKLQKEMISEVAKKIKPSNVKFMSEKSLTNDMVKEVIVDTFNGNQMAQVGKNFGRDIVDGIQVEIESRETAREIAKKNPNLALWLYGNAAQNVGLSLPIPPGGKVLGRPEVRNIVKEEREVLKKERETKAAVLGGGVGDVGIISALGERKEINRLMKGIKVDPRKIRERAQKNFSNTKDDYKETIRKEYLKSGEEIGDWFREEAEQELKREMAKAAVAEKKATAARETRRPGVTTPPPTTPPQQPRGETILREKLEKTKKIKEELKKIKKKNKKN